MPIDPEDVARILRAIIEEPLASRSAVLDRECGADAELRRHIEGLLKEQSASDATDDTFIGSSDSDPASWSEVDESGATRFGEMPSTAIEHPLAAPSGILDGRYTLQKKIGEGGMGEVWIAQQSEPIRRSVALKLIKAGMDTRAVLVRFEQERQALALMDHPNIAKVFDAGTTPTGQPFFVMELVQGLPLTKFCDSEKLSPKDRLGLFVSICQAVQHAHQKGIVHRDLKPANILVTVVDGQPVPKVIDFGVAKATAGKLTEETMVTGFGTVVGTLEYMAPEQAGTIGDDVDTRADIYSLGVVLYELLTGLRPFDGRRLRKAALSEMIRIIREDDPTRPSTALSAEESLPSLAAVRNTEPKKLMAELRGELDWVIMKCLEKSRERRYETASGLAQDIQRYLSDEPVQARPPSTGYRLQKFVSRHRSTVLASSVILICLVAGIIGTTWGLLKAKQQTGIAVLRAHEAETARLGEEQQKERALLASRQAFDALDSFTSDLMVNLLGSKAQLTETERGVLQNAQQQWNVFAQSRGTSAESREIQANGATNLSLIQYRLGLDKEAEANDRKALNIRETLATEFPDNVRYRKLTAMSHQNLGGSLRGRGQRTESSRHFQQAADIFEALATDFPDETDFQVRLADSYISLGNVERDFGNWDISRQHYLKALDLQSRLVRDFPESKDFQIGIARSHWGLAFLNKRQDRKAESTGHYQKAIAVYEDLAEATSETPESLEYRHTVAQLRREFGVMLSDSGDDDLGAEQLAMALPILQDIADQFPSMPRYQAKLAQAHRDYGQILGFLDRPSEAGSQFEKAVQISQRLTAEHATVLPYRAELGITFRMRADLMRDGEEPAEALDWYQKAIQVLTATHVQDTNYTLVRNSLCTAHRHRAETLDHLQRHKDALQDWSKVLELCSDEQRPIVQSQQADSLLRSGSVEEAISRVGELEKIKNDNPAHWFNFAKLYAIASEKVPGRADEFANHAMTLLTKAVDMGFSDVEQLDTEVDLKALRKHADFQALRNRVNPVPVEAKEN